jgi:hypothetical protein
MIPAGAFISRSCTRETRSNPLLLGHAQLARRRTKSDRLGLSREVRHKVVFSRADDREAFLKSVEVERGELFDAEGDSSGVEVILHHDLAQETVDMTVVYSAPRPRPSEVVTSDGALRCSSSARLGDERLGFTLERHHLAGEGGDSVALRQVQGRQRWR